jgi:hypothetical protein
MFLCDIPEKKVLIFFFVFLLTLSKSKKAALSHRGTHCRTPTAFGEVIPFPPAEKKKYDIYNQHVNTIPKLVYFIN